MTCCVCGSPDVILYASEDQRPWCRPCAQAEGTRLLKAEHPTWYAPGGRMNRIPAEP